MKFTAHYIHADPHDFGLGVDVTFTWVAGDGDAPGYVGRQEFAVAEVRLSGPRDACGSWLATRNGTLSRMEAAAFSRLFTALVEADERLRERIDAACEAAVRAGEALDDADEALHATGATH